MSEPEKMKFESKMKAFDKIEGIEHVEVKDQDFLKKRECLVRLYIIDAFGLPGREDDVFADPYLIIRLGDTIINVIILIHFVNSFYRKKIIINQTLNIQNIINVTSNHC